MSFDPSLLTLSGWWRASFSSAPWSGTASAGTSGSHALAHIGTDPTSGTAVNGLNPATYVAASVEQLADTTDLMSDIFTVSAYTVCCLFNPASAFTATLNIFDSPLLLGDSSGIVGLCYDSNGLSLFHDDGAYQSVTFSVGTGAWALGQAYYDGSNIYLRINNTGWSTPTAAGNVLNLAASIMNGRDWSGTNFYDGSILEILTAKTALSRNTLDDYGHYLQDRYALSLGFTAPGAIAVVPDYLDSQRWRRKRLEAAQQRMLTDSQVATFVLPPYREPRYPDYLPRSGRTREYMRASLQQATDVRGGVLPDPLAQPGIDYGRAARPEWLDAWYRRRRWFRPDLQMDVDRRNVAPRELGLTQLVTGMTVYTDQVDPDNAIRPLRREIAARQPYEGRANDLPVPLPQPGTGYGYQPPYLARNWPLRVRMRTALLPFAALPEKVERTAPMADQEYPDRVAVVRPVFHASGQRDTAQNLFPIPLPQPGIGYGACPDQIAQSSKLRKWFAIPTQQFWSPMELLPVPLAQPGAGYGWWPDLLEGATRASRWFRAAEQEAAALPEFPAPLAQPGAGYDYYPPRVARPALRPEELPQADATAAFFGSTAAAITPVDLVRYPDRPARPAFPAALQDAEALPESPVPLPQPGADRGWWPERVPRALQHAARQPFATDVPPKPERAAPLADSEYVDRPWRPAYRAPWQAFATDVPPSPLPLDEPGVGYGYQADRFPWRPPFRASWQLDATNLPPSPIPLPQPGADRATFPERVIRPRLLADRQPFATDVPAAIVPLAQPGADYGWWPDRATRALAPARLQLDATNLSPAPERSAPLADVYAPERVRRPAEHAALQLDATNLPPLPVAVLQPGAGYGDYPSRVDRAGVARGYYRAGAQPFATEVPPLPVPLPQPGADRGWWPDRVDRAGVLRAQYRAAWQAFATDVPALPVPLPQPGADRATYPYAVARPRLATSLQLDATGISPLPVVSPQPGAGYALFPDGVLRPAFRTALQQETTKLYPLPVPLAQPGADRATFPDRVPRPRFATALQLDATSLSPRPEQALPLDQQPEYPAATRRPTYRAALQPFFATSPRPEQTSPLADAVYPPRVDRPRLGPERQQAALPVDARPEGTSPLDWGAVAPERVVRPAFGAARQPFLALAPAPERTTPLADFYLAHDRVRRPTYAAHLQQPEQAVLLVPRVPELIDAAFPAGVRRPAFRPERQQFYVADARPDAVKAFFESVYPERVSRPRHRPERTLYQPAFDYHAPVFLYVDVASEVSASADLASIGVLVFEQATVAWGDTFALLSFAPPVLSDARSEAALVFDLRSKVEPLG